ncbi:uncharacterized protein LOC108675828 [Hyalella azteca]|uniref:Uncharacterized protein LOC108675828 n=1 Tax=Hyalella azteca TaxID=294128 RepID=A0A8B7P2T9_HYAAZ|nr:uncharacterized protein LOC108675828 [Hyalella azteca]
MMGPERLLKWLSEVEIVPPAGETNQQFNSQATKNRKPRVLLGCSGSVASIKVPLIAAALQEIDVQVIVLPSASALHFLMAAARQTTVELPVKNQCLPVETSVSKELVLQKLQVEVQEPTRDAPSPAPNTQIINIEQNTSSGNDSLHPLGTNAAQGCSVCSQIFNARHSFGDKNSQCLKEACLDASQNERGTVNTEVFEHKNDVVPNTVVSGEAAGRVCGWCHVQQQHPTLTLTGDEMEWRAWKGRGDPVLHIQLRRWADVFVIAPLSANTLAKLANGLCDNLLTSVARAWDPCKPLLFCPAMNTFMYEHPLTARHISTLKDFGYTEVPAISKRLMCGDEGSGAMAEVADVVAAIKLALVSHGFTVKAASDLIDEG